MAALGGFYQRILYDSATNALSLTKISASSTIGTQRQKGKNKSKQNQSVSQSNKKIDDTEREKIVQSLMRNEYFQTSIFYPPDFTESHEHILTILAVNLDGRLHTVIWTDTSGNLPTGLQSIVEAIQKIASD